MPPRARSPLPKSQQQYYPAADSATFKDLLLFEERLKRNAGLLKRRKSRYQLYLTILVGTVLVLSSDVLLETQLFELPVNTGLFYYYSYRYPKLSEEKRAHARLSQYVKTCALFVLGMTLFLFFASGMYSEKVGYANKYVPHSNKALRSFNMYLNVRTQPLPSRLSRMAASLGLSFFFPGAAPPAPTVPSSPTINTAIPQRMRTRSLSPSFSSSSRDSGTSTAPFHAHNNYYGSGTEIIPPIPPSTNPRGELIFSSRVHAGFREGYERYRETYERKRMGAAANTAAGQANANASQPRLKWLLGRLSLPFFRMDSSLTNVDTPPALTPPPDGTGALGDATYSPGALRGRTTTLSSTPSASRRSSPAPGGSGGTTGRKGSKRTKGGKVSRQGTPLLEIAEAMGRVEITSPLAEGAGVGGAVTVEPGEYPSGVPGQSVGDEGGLIEVPSLGSGMEMASWTQRRSGEIGTRKRSSRGRRGSASGSFE